MFTYKIWDRKSKINGVKAADVLQIHGITEGEVGIILDQNGKVCVLQYDNVNPLSKADMTAKLAEIAELMNNPPPSDDDEPDTDEGSGDLE